MSCCRTRPPHLGCSWLKETPPPDVAENILIGIETRPKEMFPDPMECGGISEFPLVEQARAKASTVICYPQTSSSSYRPQVLGIIAPSPCRPLAALVVGRKP